MTEHESNNIYTDGVYLRAHPNWHQEDSAWKAAHVLSTVQKNGLRPSSICEVGCGAGEILRQLQLNMPGNVQFDGYDVSPQAFAICKEKANERLHFHLGNLIANTDAHYDLLLVMDVLEHVEDYMGFLRSLKPKASFHIFHIPLDISISTVFRVSAILSTRVSEGHLHYFLKNTALATLQDCGFEILDMFYPSVGIDLSAKPFPKQMMALLRKTAFAVSEDWAARVLGGFSLIVLTR